MFADVSVYAEAELVTKLCDLEAGTALPRDEGSSSGFALEAIEGGLSVYEIFLNAFSTQCGGAANGYVAVPSFELFGTNYTRVPLRPCRRNSSRGHRLGALVAARSRLQSLTARTVSPAYAPGTSFDSLLCGRRDSNPRYPCEYAGFQNMGRREPVGPTKGTRSQPERPCRVNQPKSAAQALTAPGDRAGLRA